MTPEQRKEFPPHVELRRWAMERPEVRCPHGHYRIEMCSDDACQDELRYMWKLTAQAAEIQRRQVAVQDFLNGEISDGKLAEVFDADNSKYQKWYNEKDDEREAAQREIGRLKTEAASTHTLRVLQARPVVELQQQLQSAEALLRRYQGRDVDVDTYFAKKAQ